MAIDFKKRIEEQYQRELANMSFEERINLQYEKQKAAERAFDAAHKEEDIAPVKKERTWFNTGAFDDGYQIGDVTKSILGTIGDVGSNVMEGVAAVGHNVAALTAGGVAEVADFIGKDEYADKVRNRLAGKDEETNEFLNKYSPKEKFSDASDYFGGNSLLGEKSDNLASSAGSLFGAMALQSVGVPGMATMGLQAAGGELENAYKSGATSGEAWKSAAVTGISEAVIERLSGGISFGAKTLDELWKEPLTRAITNRTANTFAKYGLDILGEGAEEVITEAVQSLGRLSYEDKTVREALFSEEARDNYIEAFIGGGIIGGGFSAKRAYDSVKTGRDYDTGLSANEQKVIDSEVGKRTTEKQKQAAVDERVSQIIAQREKKFGTTLSETKKRKIRQNVQSQLDNGKLDFSKSEIDKKDLAVIEKQVREDFDRGFIDIDSIGDMFSPEKTAQIRELNSELSKTTNEAKRAEIQAKLDELKASRLVELDGRLGKDVYLKESLKQEVLKGMEFTRETTDNDSDITKSLVESAKSVGMNNTRRMHDLFEYVDKIANHSKLKYEFTNTAELEENAEKLKIDEKGTRANGMVVTVDGETKVLINVDSDRALNFIIGHETGHVVESAGEYAKLQKLAKEYAISKDDYEHRLKSISKLYEGMNADIEKEVTADLIGEYLFTDEQFIKELTAERNVFQKIYDYIKRAYKMATAGSKEKRELEKVKRSFEKAYKEISKTTTQQTKDNLVTDADSSTLFSVTKDKNGNDVVVIDQNIYDGMLDSEKPHEYIAEFIAAEIGNSYNIIESGQSVYIGEDLPSEFTQSKYTQSLKARRKDLLNAKNQSAQNLKDIVEIATNRRWEKNTKAKHNVDAKYGFYKYTSRFAIDKGNGSGPEYEVTLVIRNDADGKKYLYDITDIKKVGSLRLTSTSQRSHGHVGGNTPPQSNPTVNSVPDNANESKKQFSLSDDNIKVYSTGYSYGETFFRMQYVENEEELGWISYGVYEGEPSIKMMEVSPEHRRKGIGKKLLQALQKKYPDTEINFGMTTPDGTKLLENSTYQVENKEVQSKLDRIKEIQAKLSEYDKTYDDFFNDKIPDPGEDYADDYNDIEYEMRELQREVRGKSTTKTFVKYSLSDSDGRKLSKGQQEYFKDSKVRDENGSLKVMYHGTPAGDFTVFKDGTYFTDNKEYADRYQSPSASSISSGKVATNPKTFEVYLDIKKPFDINDPEARKIYINDYIKGGNAMGINPYLPDAEYAKIQTIDWTEGEDLRDFLIDEGYDYDGLVLDEGADGGYGEDVQYRGKSYVVFSPNQIKRTDNANPTDNPDIRFSLSAPVEQGRELVAVHNMKSSELMKTLDLGGFPMPSIAVIKAQDGHGNYGDVSIVFGKDTIDPKLLKTNKVYSGDAWTPEFPSLSYKANEEVAGNIAAKVNKHYNDLPYYFQRDLGSIRDIDNIEDVLNREGGEERFKDRYENNYGLRQLYLAEKGDVVPMAMTEERTEMSDQQKENAQAIIDAIGKEEVLAFSPEGLKSYKEVREAWLAKNKEAVQEAYVQLFTHDGFTPEEARDIFEKQSNLYWKGEVSKAVDYIKTGGVTITEKEDIPGTKAAIDKKLEGSDYRKWFNDLFRGIEGQAGVRNKKDMFTPSGNRRDWKSLHDPVTLDNILKAMRGEEAQKGQGMFGGNILGASTREFSSISDIKAASGNLRTVPEEEHEAALKYVNDTLDGIARTYAAGKDFWDAKNTLIEAVAISETKAGIKRYLKQYDYVYSTSDAIVDDLIELRDYVRALPTGYFEAKPRRAVGLNEIEAVLIPDNADDALVSRLEEGGYNVIQYEAGNEADRAEKLNALDDLKFSLSRDTAPTGTYNVYRSDVLLPEAQAPRATEAPAEAPAEEIAPVVIPEELRYEEGKPLTEEDLPYVERERDEAFYSIGEDYAPAEADEEFYSVPNTAPLDDKSLRMLAKNMKDELNLKPKQVKGMEKIIQDFSTSEEATRETLYKMIEEEFGTIYSDNKIDEVVRVKKDLRELRIKVSDTIKGDIPDYFQWKQKNFGKIRFSNQGLPVDDVYEGLKSFYPGLFPADIDNPTDQLLKMAEVANLDSVYTEEYFLPEEQIQDVTDFIYESVMDYKREMAMKASHEANLAPIDESMIPPEAKVKREFPPSKISVHDFTESRGVQQEYDAETGEIVDDTHDIELERLEKRKKKALDDLGDLTSYTKQQAQALYDEVRMMQKGKKVSGDLGFILDRMFDGVDKKAADYEEVKDATYKKITDALLAIERSPAKPEKEVPPTESLIRNSIETKYGWRVSEIEGMKLDSRAEARRKLRKELLGDDAEFLVRTLDNAKNRGRLLLNNTDTIRANELVLGREAANKINKIIFQKAIDNESKSIAWQNKERAEIKELGIKAKDKLGRVTKESAAVQKYGEKQYVNEFGDLVKYGDDELAAEFPNVETQAKIRKAARVIREKYDTYIDTANETLTKLGFDPIKKRKDYMRHFQELNDVFSNFGIPFNAETMQEHSLPTDINGLTEFWSPQKNYFASVQPREGIRTTYDAITGIDEYISGIANLIYHTEDIQRGRAYEELIRETYGKEKGPELLKDLSPEEQKARAEKISENHLSKYAAWVHEWTNNMAGKKNKLDRAIEDAFDRAGFSVLDTIRKQVGSNMIGFNLSSSLTNLVSPIQAMAKTDKLAVAKGTADTVKNIFVKDDFMEKNSFLTARMGTDMLSKTPWAKMQDAGYIFMKGMDWFSSNQIVRSKYYELLSKGMTEEQAHAEAGKFAARIMGDRTKGAQPHFYNSKLFNIVGQFQLEVNNQLYSMFYDTYHESKENAKNDALRTAAGITFTLGQLAAYTHLFGKTFEAIAGYNPTFDIIGIIATAFGAGDDEEEKTWTERLEAAGMKLAKALPYSSVIFEGGRIPIGAALPIEELYSGKDDYGNEKSRWDTLKEAAPYYLLPGGYNQIKKTYQGLSMFDEDLPVAGSYTDSGNLRFPVEDTTLNRAQAALFGQWASGNARNYFDNERQPLKEKQIQEYAELDIPIADYWEYREGLKDKETVEEKFDYIAGLDLPVAKKNVMINNIVDREEEVDLTNYSDFGSYEEFDFAANNRKKYDWLQVNNVSYEEYNRNEVSREAYNWAYKNQEGYAVSKAVSDVVTYRQITGSLYDIKADKDDEGKSISGSRKEKVANYINGLDLDYGAKLILFKSEYPSYDDANMDIIEYLNGREDITYNDMVTILTELDFTVDADGNIYW